MELTTPSEVYVVAQALYIAEKCLADTQPSNAERMRTMREALPITFPDVALETRCICCGKQPWDYHGEHVAGRYYTADGVGHDAS